MKTKNEIGFPKKVSFFFNSVNFRLKLAKVLNILESIFANFCFIADCTAILKGGPRYFKSNLVPVLCNESTDLLFRLPTRYRYFLIFLKVDQKIFSRRANINFNKQKADHSKSHRISRLYNLIILFLEIDFSQSSRGPCFVNPALHKTLVFPRQQSPLEYLYLPINITLLLVRNYCILFLTETWSFY